jgi:glycine/D-amino acid oxidase-like deaminating enzyme/nitrite reductase/ring-hydroxylating ferredoxin subunit
MARDSIKQKRAEEEKDNNNWEIKTSGNRKPSWYANIVQPIKFTRLTRNISQTDVAIVGGGIAGMTTAYLLSKTGKKVILVEDGYIGSGETGRTTAHITHALDDRYYNLEQVHGIEGSRIAADSHTAAINLIESIVNEEKIDCDFEKLDGFLFLDPSDKKESLDRELEATHSAGINTTELISRASLPHFDTGPCLRFPNQAQFQPLKYLRGLSQAIVHHYGGEIFTETHVQEISSDRIKTSDGYSIKASNIVIATNAPIVNQTSKMYDKQEPYRTYVIGARIKKDTVPKGLYWDTGDQNSKNRVPPYHYVRIQRLETDENNDFLIVGGEDHKTGNIGGEEGGGERDIEERFKRLEVWAKERFPIDSVIYSWSGQIMEPMDSLAFIGRNSGGSTNENNNTYIATGDSGNGITHGTIAGTLLTDLISGKTNKWSALYDPSREIKEQKTRSSSTGGNNNSKNSSSSSDENKSRGNENWEKKIAYSMESLGLEQGIIIEAKGSKEAGGAGEQEKKKTSPVAIYKDRKGTVHTFSAVCTHLGCTITWNSLEESFDCPCHGSRFSNRGKVINGPANNNLEQKDYSAG